MTAVRDPRARVFADLAAAAVARMVDGAILKLHEGAPERWDVIRVTADTTGTLLDFQATDGRFAQVRLSATFVKGDLR